jgi:hypothetical protein
MTHASAVRRIRPWPARSTLGVSTSEEPTMCQSCEVTPIPAPADTPAASPTPATSAKRGCRDCGRGFDAYHGTGDAREIAFANGFVPRLIA